MTQTPPQMKKLVSSSMPSEAEEVAELKQMFRSPGVLVNRGTIPIHKRPAWDGTPLRNRPSALTGIKPVTREPW